MGMGVGEGGGRENGGGLQERLRGTNYEVRFKHST
jgi:hypothetical protein